VGEKPDSEAEQGKTDKAYDVSAHILEEVSLPAWKFGAANGLQTAQFRK
jgi:hypothetical protein